MVIPIILKQNKKVFWTLQIIIIVICLSVAMFVLQTKINSLKKQADFAMQTIDNTYEVMYIPSGKILKPLVLGFEQVVADLLWIRAINYFGGHYLTDKNYQWLYHILDIITTLDPKFTYPYKFGAIVLDNEVKQIENNNKLLIKGMSNNPDDWQIPFYIGFNFWYHLNKPDEAAKYIKIASELPGHPAYLPLFAATLHNKSGDTQTAITFLTEIYKNTADENIRREIRVKMEDILNMDTENTEKNKK